MLLLLLLLYMIQLCTAYSNITTTLCCCCCFLSVCLLNIRKYDCVKIFRAAPEMVLVTKYCWQFRVEIKQSGVSCGSAGGRYWADLAYGQRAALATDKPLQHMWSRKEHGTVNGQLTCHSSICCRVEETLNSDYSKTYHVTLFMYTLYLIKFKTILSPLSTKHRSVRLAVRSVRPWLIPTVFAGTKNCKINFLKSLIHLLTYYIDKVLLMTSLFVLMTSLFVLMTSLFVLMTSLFVLMTSLFALMTSLFVLMTSAVNRAVNE